MTYIGPILYFIGYIPQQENTIYSPLEIEVLQNGTYTTIIKKPYTPHIFYKIVKKLYEIFIFCVIAWTIPYSLYLAICNKNVFIFFRSLFKILYTIQYLCATQYFKKQHIYENIICNTTLNYYINTVLPLMCCISFIISSLNIYFIQLNYNYHIYSEIYENMNNTIFICILFFFDSLYSYISFAINACIFLINMFYHKQIIKDYSINLEIYIRHNINITKKINNIAIEFIKMKSSFNNTVTLLSNFFSSLTILGLFSLYVYINDINIGAGECINIILFVSVECLYIYSIHIVNEHIEKIRNIICTSIVLATTVFSNNISLYNDKFAICDKETKNDIDSDEIANNIREEIQSSNILLKEVIITNVSNQYMLELLSLRTIINEPWKTFQIFGVEFTDLTIVTKFLGIIIIILMSTKVSYILNWI